MEPKNRFKVHQSIFNTALHKPKLKRVKFEVFDDEQEVKRKRKAYCVDLLKDFCNETTIHGFNHIVAPGRHPLEKFGWAAATILAILGALQLCLEQWMRFVANPTVVSLEKDYRTWNNTFLALTACLDVKVNEEAVGQVIEDLWGVKESDDKYNYYLEFIHVVANATLKDLSQFKKYESDVTLQDINILDIAIKVAPPYKGIVAWFDRSIDKPFVTIMTEMGICYTMNSVVSSAQATSTEYNNRTMESPVACQYITHPCYMRVELYIFCATYYAHSPYEIIDSSSESLTTACTGQDVNTDWKVVETKASDDVKALAIDQRNCRFYTEPMNKNHKVYSGGICRRRCRNELALKYCGCKPYFLHQESAGKLCNVAGMVCLEKYKEKLFRHEGCSCLPLCVDATYELAMIKESKWTGPFSTRSSVKIGILPPRSRYKRQILFCFEDLVVSFGGAAGLFLGCSFLSGVEIIYFFLARMTTAALKLTGLRKDSTPEDDNQRKRKLIDNQYGTSSFVSHIAEYE